MVTCIQGHSDIFVLVKRGVWNWTACITQQGTGQHSVSCAGAYPLRGKGSPCSALWKDSHSSLLDRHLFPFQRVWRWHVHVKTKSASPAQRLGLLWLLDEDFAAPFSPARGGLHSAVWLGAMYSMSLGEWFTCSLQSPANPTGAQLFVLISVVFFFFGVNLWNKICLEKQRVMWEPFWFCSYWKGYNHSYFVQDSVK